ncbi:MAG: hypothetical protein LBR78_00535, partial [Holosporales bacterium]|nr:hypothetical protein [Holosporales bacterium]
DVLEEVPSDEEGGPAQEEDTPLSRRGTLHQKATTLIGGLEDVRERIGALETSSHATIPVGVSGYPPGLHKAREILDWCGPIGTERDYVAWKIYSMASMIDDMNIEEHTTGWTFRTLQRGNPARRWSSFLSTAYTPTSLSTTVWHDFAWIGVQSAIVYHNPQTTSDNYSGPINLPPMPPHSKAEFAIITLYTQNGTTGPGFTPYENEAARGLSLQYNTSETDTPPSTTVYYRLVPPIEACLNNVITGTSDANPGIPSAVRYRAIIGTYTAPPPPDEPPFEEPSEEPT